MEANDAEGSRMQKANDEPRLFPRSIVRLSVSETDCRRVGGSSIPSPLEGSYVSEARSSWSGSQSAAVHWKSVQTFDMTD